MERLFNRMSIDVHQSLISNNPDPIYLFDKEGKVLDINSAAKTIFGYTLEEYEVDYSKLLAPAQFRDAVRMFRKVLLRGEPCSYQTVGTTKCGQTLHLHVKNVPLFDKRELIGIMVVVKDVSELYETRMALQETSERLRSLFDSSADAIDIIDLDGNVLSVNSAFEEMYGWTAEEIVGKPMPTIPKERMNDVNQRRKKARDGQNTQGLEVTCIKKDGTTIEVSITLSTLHDEKGNVVAYSGITRDISERKRLEVDLRESKHRYRSLIHSSPEPIFVQSKGVIRYMNDIGSQMFGYSDPKDVLGRNILDFIHPDSMAIATEQLQSSICTISNQRNKIERKMLRADGSSFIAEGTTVGIEYDGEPAVQVILRDVTERIKMMEKLTVSEEKYRLIANNMTDLVAIIDANGVVKYASPSSLKVLGNSSEYYENKSAFDFLHHEDLPDVLEKFNNVFSTKESSVIEFRVKHKTKGLIWIESKGSFFFDEEHGEPYLLFVAYSIGERKALQEELKRMAFHDELTELPNRRLFQERMMQTLKEAKRRHQKCALLYLDIDKFKRINDHYGHSIGDELLQQFGKRVATCLRDSDTLARQGGDEFTILLPNIEDEENALVCARRIVDCLQEPWTIAEQTFKTTSSIGIACYPRDGVTMDELMKRADQALYAAKENGRNTVICIRHLQFPHNKQRLYK